MQLLFLLGIGMLFLLGCSAQLPQAESVDEPAPTQATEDEAETGLVSAEVDPIPAEPTATPAPVSLPDPVNLPGNVLFSFSAQEPPWATVDDNVMGGVSSSDVAVVEETLVFAGTMSLDNNGGFSSVRSPWTPTDLSGYDGVLMRVLGDGNAYRFRIRAVETGANISYNALFDTTPETWKLVYVPFDEMVPTFFGRQVNAGALDISAVGSFGFMLSDKQPGEFGLAVDWIRVVTEADLREATGMAAGE